MRDDPLDLLVVIRIFIRSGGIGGASSIGSTTLRGRHRPAAAPPLIQIIIAIALEVMVIIGGARVQLAIVDRLVQVEEALACRLLVAVCVLLHLARERRKAEQPLLPVVVRVD